MKPLLSMRDALSDREVFGEVLSGSSWDNWRTLLIAMMGEELTARERVFFESVTGRPREPLQRVEELHCIIGRRSGKTRAAATLAAYLAGLVDYDRAWGAWRCPGLIGEHCAGAAGVWLHQGHFPERSGFAGACGQRDGGHDLTFDGGGRRGLPGEFPYSEIAYCCGCPGGRDRVLAQRIELQCEP